MNNCCCESIGAPPEIRFCADHHRYFLGDKKLASVSRVIRECWPIKKSFEYADPAVLEHARERGIRVDRYFEQYLKTGSIRIPNGEWMDVIELIQGLIKWWDAKGLPTPKTQQIVHDHEIAGTVDLLWSDRIIDLKCVSALDPTYKLQLGAYAEIAGVQSIGVIHANAKGVKLVEFDFFKCALDWNTLRDMWSMVNRIDPNGMAKTRNGA